MKAHLKPIAYLAGATLFLAPSVLASADGGAGFAQPSGTPANLFGGAGSVFGTIADILIYLAGAVAVIMLIVGGFRYVTSQGDAGSVKQAKDTILYSIIGIVVAILAFAVVHFVAGSLTPKTCAGLGLNGTYPSCHP